MFKDITNCPGCGKPLEDTGVFEAHRWLHRPDDSGKVNGKTGKFDGVTFTCASCGRPLEFRDSDDSDVIQIIG